MRRRRDSALRRVVWRVVYNAGDNGVGGEEEEGEGVDEDVLDVLGG